MDESISKLCETMSQGQQMATLTGLTLPSFSGSPNEDVIEFLDKFKTATFVLNDELRCLALRKALTGSARVWSKNNLKDEIAQGNWKQARKLLLDRFQQADQQQRYLENLAKMRYDSKTTDLRSYVERYEKAYKKAHKTASDKDIIESLAQNLPSKIKLTLNLISENWTSLDSLKLLEPILKRVDQTIIPYEPPEEEPQEKLDVPTMSRLLKQMQEDFKKDCLEQLKTEAKTPKEEAVAAIGRFQYQPRFPQGANQSNFRRNQYQGFYNRNLALGSFSNKRRVRFQDGDNGQEGQQRPPQPNSSGFDGKARLLQSQDKPEAGDAKQAYYRRYGRPPGPCYHCKQDHYNRHCPYVNLN